MAEVILSMGRQHLAVNGIVVATEGDKCRDPLWGATWEGSSLRGAARLINEKHWKNWHQRFTSVPDEGDEETLNVG